MKAYRLIFLILLTLISACEVKDTKKFNRPQQPWAIRSVLDYHPRMLTLALDSSMYAAYDLENCRFYKAWKGGVNWDGIVFNDTKVIQPTTWGTDYVEDTPAATGWWLEDNSEKIIPEVRFSGYRFQNEQIYLSYNLIAGQDTIRITERPEYIENNGAPGLERIFYRSGTSKLPLYLKTQSQTLTINQPVATLKSEFAPLPEQIQQQSPVRTDDRGRYWLEKSDCFTCHEWNENTVGPGFSQIAGKYTGTDEVVQYLVERVKQGGSGTWGNALMNPHPDLLEEDLQLMIEFILSLDDSEDNQGNQIAEPVEEVQASLQNPGFGSPLSGVHPSYDLVSLEPPGYNFTVGGMAFLPDGRLLVTTWSPEGSVYLLSGVHTGDSSQIKAKLIAQGLMEPLGATVVGDSIYVLQKHELTRLIDHDGDDVIDEYKVICNSFGVSNDFHEFAFGLLYRDGYFYANLSIPMRLMVNEKPLPDRGRTVRIALDGSFEHLNSGLRQPNGIGFGVDEQIFITDNQGQWLPGNKFIHLREGAFNGMRWVLPDSLQDLEEVPPAVWLPQDEIANSPSEPTVINDGPYRGQMVFGDVSHGGIKRVFLELINGEYQGVVFRFTQGLKAGVNRLRWGPDGGLYIGEAGMVGGWSWNGQRSGLQRMKYNGKSTFEMLSVKATNSGFQIEFTEPLAEGQAGSVQDYLVHQWRYQPTASYGGPKLDLETLAVSKVEVSGDRKAVHLAIPGLKAGSVVYFLLNQQITSASGGRLWSGEAWYTLNNKSKPGF